MPFFRQRKQDLREKEDLLDVYAQLTGFRAEQISCHADDVADIENLVQLVCLFADRILLYVDLQALSVLEQVKESCFAHAPDALDASGNPDTHSFT